jgi:outer membrane biosynthesis protein TonB
MAASALVHLAALAVIVVFAEVHPFSSVTAQPIAVDIVAPDEVKAELRPTQTEPSEAPDPPAPAAAPAPTPQAAMAPPAPAPPPAAAPEPEPRQQGMQPPPSPQPAAQPSYTPAQPDLTVKYNVALGLPQNQPADGFDAVATQKANIGSDLVAAFRRHLRTCSTLPESVAASDKVTVKLRVVMSQDGRLASEPMLIEASASAKGPLLMRGAIAALKACEPYAMLPADKYREWRILDLSFTPQDFTGAS